MGAYTAASIVGQIIGCQEDNRSIHTWCGDSPQAARSIDVDNRQATSGMYALATVRKSSKRKACKSCGRDLAHNKGVHSCDGCGDALPNTQQGPL